MLYAGFLIRQERLKRNWSQEGLCKDICTVSYLSKIEKGKAEPSEEILRMLMSSMGLKWFSADREKEAVIQKAYEILWGFDEGLQEFLSKQDADLFIYSPYGPDWLLLCRYANDGSPVDEELETCLNHKQLALQRILQGRCQEAICLFPIGFVQYMASVSDYNAGRYTPALEKLQSAYQQAAQEGRARLMLYCKMMMGNCYSNQNNLPAMEHHYEVALRLAESLLDESAAASIAYNRAATQVEMGDYEQALIYFKSIENPKCMALHKHAICLEKLGRKEEALSVLDKAQTSPLTYEKYGDLEMLLLDIVRVRVEDPDYLKNADYGEKLIRGFDLCLKLLPSGYAQFHLPWLMEWYEHNRQYKKAMEVLRFFPEKRINH